MSPYKNGNKQRKIMKETMREKYKKAKGLNALEALTMPLMLWMKFARKDNVTEVRLVKIGKYEIILPVLSLESMIRTLEVHDFPEKVQVLGKKFVLKCVEVKEGQD